MNPYDWTGNNFLRYKFVYLIPVLVCLGFVFLLSCQIGNNFLYNHDHFLFVSLNDVKQTALNFWTADSLGKPFAQVSAMNWFSYLSHFLFFKLGLSIKAVELLFIFLSCSLTWYLSWIAFFYFGKGFSKNSRRVLWISLLASYFYAFNLYLTIMFHTGAGIFDNFFLTYSLAPLLFYFIHRYFQDENIINKFLVLSLIVSFFCFGAVPWFYVFCLFLFLFLLVNIILKNFSHYSKIFKKIIVLGIIFVAINSFFLIPLGYAYLDKSKMNIAIKSYSALQKGGLLNQLRLFNWWTFTAKWNGRLFHSFSPYYFNPIVIISIFLFYFILIKGLVINNIKKTKLWPYYLSFIIIFLIFLFLSKGVQAPFGNIFTYLFKYFPLFKVLRNPDNKLAFILILSLSHLILISLLEIKSKKKYIFCYIAIITTATIYNVPFFTGDAILEKNKGLWFDNVISVSKDYNEIHNLFNYKKNDFSILSIPGIRTSSYIINSRTKAGHSGQDLFRRIVNKPVIYLRKLSSNREESYELIKSLHKDIDLVSLTNVKYIALRWDILENLRRRDSEAGAIDLSGFSNNLSQRSGVKKVYSKKENVMSIYEISNKNFLPHFYTPKDIITSDQTIESLPQIVSQPDYKIRSAIYFENQNEDKIQEFKKLPSTIENTPTIEFKKVNPTKYRVIVHQARDNFPLVFSESFHKGWKAYLAAPDKLQIANNKLQINPKIQITNYKILEGNEEDQASRKELADYINQGWISDLGDGKEKEIKHKKYLKNGKKVVDHIEKYKIDFVSKNFQDTIQNDNLPEGHIWNTWFKKPLPEENHLMANGYANSWFVDLGEVKKSGKYIENPDGSIDFELIVEFWPQRLFYLGLGISGLTLLGCIGYLGFSLVKSKKKVKHRAKSTP